MSAQEIIAKQTGAVTVPKIVKITEGMLPATLIGSGLTGADSIPVSITVDDGVTSDVVSQEGVAVVLSVANNAIAINSPLTLSVTKPVTTGAAGVFIAGAAKV